MEIQIHFTMQKYNLQKNPLRETKILQGYHNSITKSQTFNTSQKNIIFQSKNPGTKIDLLLLLLPPRGQNLLKLLYTL
jgi:hypothetical protein